ncbi:hypothetical protein AVEN_781-1 [Araneus ventricosus]|uniref:Uncharacterized protein n=1 Tax=Araneus ventricosus TaxID=182803 RepID=A0A4Y2H5I1_ARAVE|nr:hypothetical protein AVEN_781-1 [Araneus ventricosus]
MKRSPLPNVAVTKRREIIPREQSSAVLEKLSEKIQVEDEADALYLDGEVTEYNDQETDYMRLTWRIIQFTKNVTTQTRTQMFVSYIHSTSNLIKP